MPTITREFSITYGSVTVGGSSDDYLLMRQNAGIFESYKRARVDATVLVVGTSEADFLANCTALVSQFRTPRARLQVARPTGYADFNPATNSGFNAEPEIRESSDRRFHSNRMRLYDITVTVDLPADLSGQDGRRDNTYAVSYEANRRRTITLSGQYTALGGNDATAQYEASIDSYVTSVLPGGATWQLIKEDTSRDDTDKIIGFTRQYREITLNQDGSGPDNASVVVQTLSVTKVDRGSPSYSRVGGRTVIPMATYRVSYSAVIDIEQTDNTGLNSLWETTLRSYVVSQANSRLGIGPDNGGAVSNETLTTDPENNTITASFDYMALDGSLLVEARMTKGLRDESGTVFTPVTTGRPYEYSLDDGPPRLTLTVTIDEKTAGNSFFNYVPPNGYQKIYEDPNVTEEYEGDGSRSIRFLRRRFTGVYMFAKPYTGGGAGGSTSSVTRGGAPTKTITNPSGSGL